MEKCLMEFDSQSKNSSEEALRKWRLAVGGMVKNPRRRFRMVADLVKRKEAEKRLNIQVFWKWFIVIFNLLFEILTLAFDQVSSPAKPVFALVGLLLSLVVVAICVIEFSWKAHKAKVIRRQLGRICWFYYPSPSDMLFGNFVEIFGLICAILQVLSSAIQYGFFHRHADNPIKFSLFPVIFATSVACSKLLNNPNNLPHRGHSIVDFEEETLVPIHLLLGGGIGFDPSNLE